MQDITTKTKLVSQHVEGAVYLDPIKQHHLFISTRNIQKGEVICAFAARETLSAPNRFTVQIGENQHILLSPLHLQYINHSCSPNAFFDTDAFQLIALRPMEEGDEITFFYPSTEWTMEESFTCKCGELNCIGTISGAVHIPKPIINQYQLTQFIQSKLNADH
jgi:hypothetical protein